jgi:predicted XRE-type DNA-binding protein
MQSGQAIREAITLEREKEMEFNTIMQALIKDIAEQLRPTVAEMVRQELANTQGDKVLGNIAANIDLSQLTEYLSEAQLAYVAEHLSDTQLVTVAENVSASDVASELSSSQLSDIAGDIDLADLAGEFDTDKIMANVDMDEIIRDFFSNNTFSIRP